MANNEFDMQSFLDGLKADLESAIRAPEQTEGRSDTSDLTARVEALEKAVATLGGDGEGSINALVKALNESIDQIKEVVDKTLDRVIRLEGGTAVKKSVDGDDKDTGDSKPESPEEAIAKANAALNATILEVARQARRTGRGVAVLT